MIDNFPYTYLKFIYSWQIKEAHLLKTSQGVARFLLPLWKYQHLIRMPQKAIRSSTLNMKPMPEQLENKYRQLVIYGRSLVGCIVVRKCRCPDDHSRHEKIDADAACGVRYRHFNGNRADKEIYLGMGNLGKKGTV